MHPNLSVNDSVYYAYCKETHFWGFLNIPLVPLLFLSNILVIIVICTSTHLRKLSSVFIITLSIADGILQIIPLIFDIHVKIVRKWTLGETLCRALGFSWWIGYGVGVLSLTFISLQRYFAVVWPHKYYAKKFKKVTYVLLVVLVALPIMILSPLMFEYHGGMGYDYYQCACTIQDKNNPVRVIFTVIITGIPIIFMTYAYCHIFLTFRNMKRKLEDINIANPHTQQQAMKMKSNVALAKTMAICYAVFVSCGLANFSTNMAWQSNKNVTHLRQFFLLLTWLSSCLNPLIYGLTNKTFRLAYKKFFREKLPECFFSMIRPDRGTRQ